MDIAVERRIDILEPGDEDPSVQSASMKTKRLDRGLSASQLAQHAVVALSLNEDVTCRETGL